MAQAGDKRASGEAHHRPELDRALGLAGNILMILGALAPVATFFVYIPIMYFLFGGFTFPALLIGFALQIPMALCYAELGSAYPLAGGEYSMVARSVNRGSGFLVFGMMMFFFILLMASGGIGAGFALQALWPSVNPEIVAVVLIVAGAILGTFNVKEGAIFSSIFLFVQLIAIGIVVVLGFMHAHAPVDRLLSTQLFSPEGKSMPLTFGLALGAMTLGFYMFTGYGNAVVFGEETENARKHMGRAVLWPLAIVGTLLLVATAAVMVGAPSVKGLATAVAPMSYFVEQLGGATMNKVVNALIFIALAEFIMLTVLIVGREFWSAARDNAWPTPISKFLQAIHPKYKSPWLATAVIAAISIPFCFINIASLVTIQGVVTVVYCVLMAVGALKIRFMKEAPQNRWKMPLWPLPPIVVLVALGFMITQQTRKDLITTGIVLAVALVYYLAFLMPRRKTHWVMLDAEDDAAATSPTPEVKTVAEPETAI